MTRELAERTLTTTTGSGAPLGAEDLRVPALTVLWHPDSGLVGHRALLPDLAYGGNVQIARSRPEFGPPGKPVSRVLGDRSISRAPLRIRVANDQLCFACDGPGERVQVNGRFLNEPCALPLDALREGAVVQLSPRVTLLLHEVQASPAAQPELGMVGSSSALERVRDQVLRVAPRDVPVLLMGESGAGKELVARAIHAQSSRHQAPFVAVNMAAVPSGTVAAALFGHRKGAFTGATASGRGYFQQADGGTLFLDEVAATPLDVQAVLLRVLETGELQAVGDADATRVDVRVLAATDTDLERATEAGEFRLALAHRLRGYEIRVPALRERRDDIGLLLLHFLQCELQAGQESHRVSGQALSQWLPATLVSAIARRDYPGNVRELRNVARRIAVDYADCDVVDKVAMLSWLGASPTDRTQQAWLLPGDPEASSDQRTSSRPSPEASEEAVLAALARENWKPSRVARALGVSRTTVYSIMKRSGRARKAADLSRDEILAALQSAHSDIRETASALRVSERGLRLRMTQLGID